MKYIFAVIAGTSITVSGLTGLSWMFLGVAVVSFLASIDIMIQEAKRELLDDSK